MIHPWDISDVHKGWQLSVEDLSAVTGQQPDTGAYQIAVLNLAKRLDRELDQAGRPCTVALVKGCLRVLTDAEATAYNERRQRYGERTIFKAHYRQTSVDVSALSSAEADEHDRRLVHSSMRCQALRSSRSQFRKVVKAGSESKPSLPGAKAAE